MDQMMNVHRALEGKEDDYNVLLHFHDPREDDMPSMKFTIWIFLGVFLSMIAMSAIIVCTILSCSRAQEEAKTKSEESKC